MKNYNTDSIIGLQHFLFTVTSIQLRTKTGCVCEAPIPQQWQFFENCDRVMDNQTGQQLYAPDLSMWEQTFTYALVQ